MTISEKLCRSYRSGKISGDLCQAACDSDSDSSNNSNNSFEVVSCLGNHYGKSTVFSAKINGENVGIPKLIVSKHGMQQLCFYHVTGDSQVRRHQEFHLRVRLPKLAANVGRKGGGRVERKEGARFVGTKLE